MLYRLDKKEIELSMRMEVRTPSHFGLREKDIENFLRSRLGEIVSEDQLMLIGQERQRQEEADLLALDKDGTLFIFELKRWESRSENLLQVMRYGQIFGRYTYQQLEYLAKRQQKLKGSLKENHKGYFDLEEELLESDFNKEQVFVIVTHGMDKDTMSAVNFWCQKGVRIECSPYRLYEIDGKPYIHFDTYNPEHEAFAEENNRIYIVNTNESYIPNAWKDMLNNVETGCASAYYVRKHSISRILKGDIVYLYHTGEGFVAKGQATAGYWKTDYLDDKDAVYSIPLEFEWALPYRSEWKARAPKAWEINHRLGTGHKFRQTVSQISPELAKEIDNIFAERKSET